MSEKEQYEQDNAQVLLVTKNKIKSKLGDRLFKGLVMAATVAIVGLLVALALS